jgi:hAT family C-terminal dimerisation region
VDGCEWPELQKTATKLFSMATSSATAEHKFSTMVFIHSKLCNSLMPKTVEKLVFIKSNLAAFYNFYRWLSMSHQIVKMKISKPYFLHKIGFF